MKIIVTGAAGFIGSNLVDFLLKDGHVVIGLDNFSNGLRSNLSDAVKNNNFSMVAGDLLDVKNMANVIRDVEPDAVYHLAARGSVPASILDPSKTFNNNVLATQELMILCMRYRVKRFIYASSSSVYGDSIAEFKREDQPLYPTNPYGISKYVTELYGENFHKLYKLNCAAIRFFNVYGPRQRHDLEQSAVVPTFIKKSMDKEPISINGDGHSRDFTFVHDVTRALSMFLRIDPKTWAGQAYNICTGKETSVAELSSIIRDLVGNKGTVEFNGARTGDIKRSVGCNKKLLKDLYWAPSTTVKSGLFETIQWYKSAGEL